MDSLQVTLNSSMKQSMHVYGHSEAICADMGVPPLRLTQQDKRRIIMQLAQLPIEEEGLRSAAATADSCSSFLLFLTRSRVSSAREIGSVASIARRPVWLRDSQHNHPIASSSLTPATQQVQRKSERGSSGGRRKGVV